MVIAAGDVIPQNSSLILLVDLLSVNPEGPLATVPRPDAEGLVPGTQGRGRAGNSVFNQDMSNPQKYVISNPG
jgi:hypothetical protein